MSRRIPGQIIDVALADGTTFRSPVYNENEVVMIENATTKRK